MNDDSTTIQGLDAPSGPSDAEAATARAEADKSLANAYEAVADFIKELKAES